MNVKSVIFCQIGHFLSNYSFFCQIGYFLSNWSFFVKLFIFFVKLVIFCQIGYFLSSWSSFLSNWSFFVKLFIFFSNWSFFVELVIFLSNWLFFVKLVIFFSNWSFFVELVIFCQIFRCLSYGTLKSQMKSWNSSKWVITRLQNPQWIFRGIVFNLIYLFFISKRCTQKCISFERFGHQWVNKKFEIRVALKSVENFHFPEQTRFSI